MAQTLLIGVGDVTDKLRPMILDRIAKLKVGPGMEPGMDMGPIYNKEHRDSIVNGSTVAWRRARSSSSTAGAGRSETRTVLAWCEPVRPRDAVMDIYNEEIFGPVLGIVRVETYDEAIALVNGHQYANGTAIFTTDGGAARRFKLEVDVPMVGVNVPIPVPAGYLSFTGGKLSSFGDMPMRGEDGLRFFSRQKEVTDPLARAGQARSAEPRVPRQQLVHRGRREEAVRRDGLLACVLPPPG